jgi:hypothetical protein
LLEAGIVAQGRCGDEGARRDLDLLVVKLHIEVVAFTAAKPNWLARPFAITAKGGILLASISGIASPTP